MSRVTIADIVRETGLSRATVDRVINKRSNVHPRTRAQVELVLQRMTAPIAPASPLPPVDVALRLDRGLMDKMFRAAESLSDRAMNILDLHQMSDADVLREVKLLCQDVTRTLILTVKNTTPIVMELAKARRRGKRIIALISDLATEARDAYVGIDNRAAGQTAAFIIGRAMAGRPTTVGFVLGDHAYRCHEDREIGFRTALRTHFPKVMLAAEAIGQDNAPTTHVAVTRMLESHPGIAAIYSVAGGHAGIIKAIQEKNLTGDIMVVVHEANDLTVPPLRHGQFDFLISQDPAILLAEALRQADNKAEAVQEQQWIDFNVHTQFNIPKYAR